MISPFLLNICRRSMNYRLLCNVRKRTTEVRLLPIRCCHISMNLDDHLPTYDLTDFSRDLKKYLRSRPKSAKRRYDNLETQSRNDPVIIKCKDKKLNFYVNQNYSKNEAVPLASENWGSHKSVGDFFTIEPLTPAEKESPLVERAAFVDTNLDGYIIDILKKKGLEFMSEIQELAIPPILAGRDCLIAAQTGTGKTLAYLLPIIHQIMQWKEPNQEFKANTPYVIIISPNRELTEQIREIVQWFKPLGISSHKMVGGSANKKIHQNPFVQETDILVSTPGILNKLLTTGVYSLERLRHIVLDEADTLLDDSFNDITARTLNRLNFREHESDSGCQITLCGATMPTSLEDILGEMITVENFIKIEGNNVHQRLSHVRQKFLRVSKASKTFFVLDIAKKALQYRKPLIIFCNHSDCCFFVSSFLNESGVPNVCINGDVILKERKGRFKQFQNQEVFVMVCTDVASRGLDTTQTVHVLNYDFPVFIVDYIHRCGRTGRLGNTENCRITNLISGKNEISTVQKIEIATRLNTKFENVNPNIKRIIKFRGASHIERALGLPIEKTANNDDL